MKTKRVRIAVAVTASGAWNSVGWSSSKSGAPTEIADSEKRSYAVEPLDEDATVHWVEADIPIPEETTIEGTVTK